MRSVILVCLYLMPGFYAWGQLLQTGDSVTYREASTRKGTVVVLGEMIGEGNNTRIFEIIGDPNRVVRVPKDIKKISYGTRVVGRNYFINSFLNGYQPLTSHGVPTVSIHGSRRSQFVVVDFVQGPTLKDFILNPSRFSEVEKQKMLDGLIAFARTTAAFGDIGDFKSDSLVFDRSRGWLLIDWTHTHVYDRRTTTFLYLLEEFEEAVQGKRVDQKWLNGIIGLANGSVRQERVEADLRRQARSMVSRSLPCASVHLVRSNTSSCKRSCSKKEGRYRL